MRRTSIMFVGLALVISACGGETTTAPTDGEELPGSSTTTTAAAAAQDSSTTSTTVDAGGDSSSTSTTPSLVSDFEGDPAPDFTLALADGGSYTLSEGSLPLYMVFWAEW